MTTLGDRIVASARRTPDALAVAQWDARLTYAELVGRATTLALALRDRGVGPEIRVGICARRTPAMVVAVVGVLLSGGAYVPLDPEHPVARRRDMAADAGVSIVVGDGPDMLPIPAEPALDPLPPSGVHPDNLAHVLYTSGSTGRPKGVLTTHANVIEFVDTCATFSGAGPRTRSLGIASLGFDATTMDLFVPLCHGGSVQLVGESDRADPTRLGRFIAAHEVNWGFITPTLLALLDPDEVPSWRLIMCGGEVVPVDLAHAWWRAGRRVFNAYGPTETTVLVTVGEVTGAERESVPIGRPLPGHYARVIDGELCIGGPGVARGYLGRPALTAQRFVPDPAGGPGARLYRTGDLARVDDAGRVHYLGRRDGQIQVRGQRVEIGEIEAVLREDPGVDQVAVAAIDRATGLELVAFVTPATGPTDPLERAADRLTRAMLPSRLFRLDALPRNVSGKVDRDRLRELALSGDGAAGDRAAGDSAAGDRAAGDEAAGDAPRGGDEAAVAQAWQRVVGGWPSRDAGFFASGGNSISAMRLVAVLRTDLGRDVAVEDVFAGRTLAGIAARVAAAPPLSGAEIDTGHPPTLTSPQRRMWFADQLAPGDAPYNIPLAQRLRGPLDEGALRAALTAVAERHDALRWRIASAGGVPVPLCEPPAEVPMPVVDVAEADLREWLAESGRRGFDLATEPPWRVHLLRLGPEEHVLTMTLHHAVFDGWSQRVLYGDLATAYTGKPLPPRTAGYADYAVWRNRRERDRGDADLAWWLGRLAGVPTVVDLPTDRPRPAVAGHRAGQATITLPTGSDATVRRLAASLGTTPAAVLLAALGQLLRRITGTTDQVVGAVLADRQLAEFEDVIGFFVDMVPVRLHSDDTDFAEHVRSVGAELRASTEHAGAPIERVVDGLGLPRDPSRAPLVQVMFNVLNFADPVLDLPGVRAETIEVDKPGSPVDLTLYVRDHDARLAVDALFNADLFDTGRIERLLGDYVALLGALATAPDVPVAAVTPWLGRPEPPGAPPPTPPAAAPALADDLARAVASAATRALVTQVWRDVLGMVEIGPTANFFDLGGDSLALAAVRARLADQLGRPVALIDLFRYPNIQALATFLDGGTGDPEYARSARRAAARRAGRAGRPARHG